MKAYSPIPAAACALTIALSLAPVQATAQKSYDVGASDGEIRIGNTMPYSGPASGWGIIGKTLSAVFTMVNDQGGINGRKIRFISYDDGYSPPKTVEQTRKLVESDEVLLTFASLGTGTNAAVQKYLNQKGVPQLFLGSGASRWGDPKHFPWTIGLQPSYRSEARIYARYILQNHPGKTIGVLFQNDDFGKDYLDGLKDVLGDRYSKLVVREAPFEVSAPTIDSQVLAIKSANPDILIDLAAPKFVAQAIKKLAEVNWRPLHIITAVSASPGATLKPAGFENSKGVLSAAYQMIVSDPEFEATPGMIRFRKFMAKYYPDADKTETGPLTAWNASQVMIEVLKRCGDNLTRANVMKHAASLDMTSDTYIPGVVIKTSPTNYYPVQQLQMMRFNGERWEMFGPIIDGKE